MSQRRSYTAREKLRCVERELKYRNHTYPRRVNEGRMTQLQADREIYVMEDIAADYTALIRAEEPELKLTGQDLIDWKRDHARELRDDERDSET